MLSVVLKSIPLLFLLMFIVILASSHPAQLPVLMPKLQEKLRMGRGEEGSGELRFQWSAGGKKAELDLSFVVLMAL